MAGTHYGSGLLAFDIQGAAPVSPDAWPGFSGAVVRAERTGHLVGVVNARAGSHSGSRLNVTPISRLLADEDVPQWIGGSSFEIDELRQREDTILLDEEVTPAYRPRPVKWTDQELLVPDFQVVEFIGRTDELRRLREWCLDEKLTSVAAVSGDGGAGKSRLAAQLCREMDDLLWSAGIIPAQVPDRVELARPTLAVVDYVEEQTHYPSVRTLIERFHGRARGPKLRLLLSRGRLCKSTGRGWRLIFAQK